MDNSNKKTLTRSDIADAIIDHFRISKFNALEVVETVLEEISSALRNEESVKLTGFGTFTVSKKKERMGRNPKTMEAAVITSRKSLKFRPSQILKQIVNGADIDISDIDDSNEN
ncbi:MAG: integration host factor subunit alpha [Alphaproteobacteria bacterium]|nr:integration host factor subunit alpha [Alphaproteobacteria bacterium]